MCSRGVRIIVVWSRTRGAIHMPRTHHQATRGDITTRSAAVPHSAKSSAKHAPPLERLCLCVVLWPSGVWLCFLIRFLRARSRDVAKGALAAERLPKIENYEKGALFRVKPSG